jgi:hypothetical protein
VLIRLSMLVTNPVDTSKPSWPYQSSHPGFESPGMVEVHKYMRNEFRSTVIFRVEPVELGSMAFQEE